MSKDFETVRIAVGVQKWMLFGGSWGSTLGLQYLLDFPNSVIAQVTRGILLDNPEHHQDVYAMSSIRKIAFPDLTEAEANKKRALLIDMMDEVAGYAQSYVAINRHTPGSKLNEFLRNDLIRNDPRKLLQVYEALVVDGNLGAVWRWFALEENSYVYGDLTLADTPSWQDSIHDLTLFDNLTPANLKEIGQAKADRDELRFKELLAKHSIREKDWNDFREAAGCAFFEPRLFLNGSWEKHEARVGYKTILDRIKTLPPSTPKVPIWFVSGTRDVICPYRYAQWLGEALRPAEGTNLLREGAFVQGGHSSSKNPGVKKSEYGFVQVIREEWEAGFLHQVMLTKHIIQDSNVDIRGLTETLTTALRSFKIPSKTLIFFPS